MYDLPQELTGIFSINLLEYLAAAITIFIAIKDSDSTEKIIEFTDSSSAHNWFYKTIFNSNQHVHDKVARWLAKMTIDNDAAL